MSGPFKSIGSLGAVYCKTLLLLHLNFAYVENSPHFNLAYSPGVDILCWQSYCYGQIPEIRV